MTLRKATDAEVAVVREIVQDAYSGYVDRIGRRPAPMDADYAALVEAGRVWVAETDLGVGGLAVLVAHVDHLLVENVAVRPEVHGRGIGSALLELAERQARERGLHELRLYTHELMTENLAYYPRRGFVETHRAVVEGFSRVFFTRRL